MSDQGSVSTNGPPSAAGSFVDESFFRILLNLEIQKAMRLQYCVSVVFMSIEASENGHGNGNGGDPALARHLAEMAMSHLRATDVVTTLAKTSLGLLLVDAETRSLPRILNRATEAWEDRAVSFEGRELRLKWSAGGGCYPQTATSVKGLVRQAGDLMTRAKEEGGDRLYLPA